MIFMLTTVLNTAWAGSHLNIDEMSINGVQMQSLQCELSSGGLFAGAAVIGSFAQQKEAIDACAPQGAAARLKWTWSNTAPVKLEVIQVSQDGLDACLTEALKKISPSVQGACTGVLLVGEPEAAKTAAVALPAAP